MTNRERFLNTLRGKPSDRIPMTEICFWPDTIQRWEKEGLPEKTDPLDFLRMERITIAGFDCSLQIDKKMIEETADWKIETDENGVTMKSWKTAYAPPQELDFKIKTESDWKQLKPRLVATWERFSRETIAAMEQAHTDGNLVTIRPEEPCWFALRTIGHKECLELMALEPAFIEDIIATKTDFILEMMALGLTHGLTYDALWFFSDLCYRGGMLFSPAIYRRMILPYHRKVKDFCTRNNLPLLIHCCGDVRQLIPLLMEAGFDCVQPLEARAGNDVRKLKPLHGNKMAFFGNINIDVLARGNQKEIEEEVVTKVEAAKAGGGYIFHSDHSVPPTVSFASYRLAVELARKHGVY